MPEAEKVVNKLKELFPSLLNEDIGVRALKRENQWLVFLSKEGHEEMFVLPEDFVSSCVEMGYCHLYRDKCTRAMGLLMEAINSYRTSSVKVIEKLKRLIPELNASEITIAASEDEQTWSFFMTKKGISRPVEFKLPTEIILRCDEGECQELKEAARIAYRCLQGI